MVGDELVVGALRLQLGKINSSVGNLAKSEFEVSTSTSSTNNAEKWQKGMRYRGQCIGLGPVTLVLDKCFS